MAKKFYEEEDIRDIAVAIREKNGSTDTYKPSEMGDAVRAIEGGGSEVNIDEVFYDLSVNWQSNFDGIFGYSAIYPKSLPLLRFDKCKTIAYMCRYNTALEEVDYYIDPSTSTLATSFSARSMFFKTTNLKRIVGVNFSVVSDVYEMFKFSGIETIERPIDLSKITNNLSGCFVSCSNLKNISFVEGTIQATLNMSSCPLLTSESVQSIIDGLKDLTDATAQTITFHSSITANLTDEQIEQIISKNWILK